MTLYLVRGTIVNKGGDMNLTKDEYRRRMDRCKAAGLCWCGRPARENRTTCQHCADRKKRKRYSKKEYQNIKRRAMQRLGGACTCCGVTELDFLTIDHINNDGGEQRKAGQPSGQDLYRLIANAEHPPEDLQVLCWNCNMSKRVHGICIHKL